MMNFMFVVFDRDKLKRVRYMGIPKKALIGSAADIRAFLKGNR